MLVETRSAWEDLLIYREEFYLTDPITEKLFVQGVPEKHEKTITTVLTQALNEYYNEHPIYSLNARDAKQAAARMVLKNVIVENSEIVITLGI